MRLLGSLIITIIFAPATYVLTGVGLVKFNAATATGASGGKLTMAAAIGALAAAGLLYAILTISRLNPLGPILAGFGYLAVAAYALTSHASFLARMPHSVVGIHGAMTGAAPVAALLAIPLLGTAFMARRWRGRAEQEREEAGESAYPGFQPAGYPTGSFQSPQAEPYQAPQASTYQSFDDPYRNYQ